MVGARRRVVRGGDRHIDTAHLLHSLLESDPEVRAAFGEGPTVSRLLGYLVQRSIGYGLRWQGSVEDSGGLPVVEGAAGFSPLAAVCVTRARERAARRGTRRCGGRTCWRRSSRIRRPGRSRWCEGPGWSKPR